MSGHPLQSDRSVARSLIFFQNDFDALTGTNVFAILAVHAVPPPLLSKRPSMAWSMAFCEARGARASPADKLIFQPRLLNSSSKTCGGHLDLYHTVFSVPRPALALSCLPSSFSSASLPAKPVITVTPFPLRPFVCLPILTTPSPRRVRLVLMTHTFVAGCALGHILPWAVE